MDRDLLIARYRSLGLGKRLLVLVALGIVPALWTLSEDGPGVQEELAGAQASRDQAEAKFKRARERKADLPKMEEKLAFVTGELQKAKARLPDEFVLDQVLERTGALARDVGVEVREFNPGSGRMAGGAFRYVEMPISLQVFGTFGQIVTFFDRVVHLDLLVHIANINLDLSHLPTANPESAPANAGAGDERRQREARDKSRILARAELTIFRTPSPSEEETAEADAMRDEKKKAKIEKKAKKPKDSESAAKGAAEGEG